MEQGLELALDHVAADGLAVTRAALREAVVVGVEGATTAGVDADRKLTGKSG
jgi:hypothetical protein